MRRLPAGFVLTFMFSAPVWAQPAPAGQGMAWTLPPISDSAVQTRADRLYAVTQRLAHYLIGQLHPWQADPNLLLLTDSKSHEHAIRPNAGTAAGLAFLYRFGPYDEKIVGVSRADLLQSKLVPMMRYLATTHVTGSRPTGDGQKWGDHWQSALWAEMLGMAAWWAGESLPADLAADVRRVVAHEADRFVDAPPPHQLRADTKAEENAWNSTVLSAAVLLMPADPRREKWEKAFQKWALSSWLRPADERSSKIIDGRPLSEQFTGANIYDDFTLENHHIVHPDYMTAWSQTLGCSVEFVLTGRKPPEALVHNVPGIYENLKWFCMPDGGFVYPSGQDWAIFRQVDWLYPNLTAAVFANDPEAWTLLDRSLEVAEKMQARSPDGELYLREENFFASAQTDKIAHFARGWLALHFAQHAESRPLVRAGVRRLDSAKIILNRTPNAVHSFCWGTKIMAQCMPVQKDRLISPDPRSGVGEIWLKSADKPLPVSLVDVHINNDEKSFVAQVVVDHGKNTIRAHLTFRSEADGTWTVREKLVALGDLGPARIDTGLIGVLNNQHWIYERGGRKVTLGDKEYTIPTCSGEAVGSNHAEALDIDSVLRIDSETPLSVIYRAARGYERSRATDKLTLNCIWGDKIYKAGQTISEWQVTVRCEPRDHE